MAVTLNWTPANWPKGTYHAATGELSYTIDKTGSQWSLRAWDHGRPVLYRAASTMKALKQQALDHAKDNR